MFDIIVLAVVGILTLMGFLKGMVRQIFGLAGVVGGYLLAVKFYIPWSRYFTDFHPATARIVAFICIFLGCVIVAHIIGWLVGRLFNLSGLGFVDTLGGGLLGFVKGCLIVSVSVMILMAVLPTESSLFKKSSTIRYILPIVSTLKGISGRDMNVKPGEKVKKTGSLRRNHKGSATKPFPSEPALLNSTDDLE